MNIELRHLRYFIAVAEELHFGRAALRLNISQPPLSQQIRQLEEAVDACLFVRNNRRVELTTAGEQFLTDARAILVQVDQAANAPHDCITATAGNYVSVLPPRHR